MKHITLITLTLLLNYCALSQTTSTILDGIKTTEQANTFIKKHSKTDAKLFTISLAKDTSDITLPLFNKQPGYLFKLENYYFKIIELNSHPEFIATYIYLDGNRLSIKSIDSLRTIIIDKLKTGANFYELAGQYTMDGNTTGYMNWFSENMMMKEFEKAVKEHKKGDIFTVDIPENKWYYVVSKPDDNRIVKELTILKVKSNVQ